MNPEPGVYDWRYLDTFLAMIQDHNLEALFTFVGVPTWASSQPTDTRCTLQVPGGCDAPNDLHADGTGTNQHWKDFVKALVDHVGGSITYWEMWNESTTPQSWRGTDAQLVRMTKDAALIIKAKNPDAKILNPVPASGNDPTGAFLAKALRGFFAAGGAEDIDIVSYHGYIQQPEQELPMIQAVKAVMTEYGQSAKPLWDTEASWGHEDKLSHEDDQAAFVPRMHLLHWSAGVTRFYWYAYGAERRSDPSRAKAEAHADREVA